MKENNTSGPVYHFVKKKKPHPWFFEMWKLSENNSDKLADMLMQQYKLERTPYIFDIIEHTKNKFRYLTRIKFKYIALYILWKVRRYNYWYNKTNLNL